MGKVLLKLNNPKEAILIFDEALTIDSDNQEANFSKGSALYKLKQYTEALPFLDASLDNNINHSETWFMKG